MVLSSSMQNSLPLLHRNLNLHAILHIVTYIIIKVYMILYTISLSITVVVSESRKFAIPLTLLHASDSKISFTAIIIIAN